MNPLTTKVLERFNYEKLLTTMGVNPRCTKITLPEILEAGLEEPRIFEALPALLVYKPTAISKLDRDIKKNMAVAKMKENLFNEQKRPAHFFGIDARDCLKAALAYAGYLNAKKKRQKSLMLTLRLSYEDIQVLKDITLKLKTSGVSETIRLLAREKSGILAI